MSRSSYQLPLLPLRDIVIFPQMMVPLYVGRTKSINAVEEAMRDHREIILAAQIKAKTNEGLDSIGKGKAVACHATVLVIRDPL